MNNRKTFGIVGNIKPLTIKPQLNPVKRTNYDGGHVMIKQLTLAELRAQFEDKKNFENPGEFDPIENQYADIRVNRLWYGYQECAKANNILREG